MAYKTITLHLDNILTDKTEIVPRGTRISEVTILSIPTGTTIQLALGDGPLISVQNNFSAQPEGDDDANRGLYWANPVAQPGVTVEVIVSYGGTSVSGARV